jgi:hypothetical protein
MSEEPQQLPKTITDNPLDRQNESIPGMKMVEHKISLPPQIGIPSIDLKYFHESKEFQLKGEPEVRIFTPEDEEMKKQFRAFIQIFPDTAINEPDAQPMYRKAICIAVRNNWQLEKAPFVDGSWYDVKDGETVRKRRTPPYDDLVEIGIYDFVSESSPNGNIYRLKAGSQVPFVADNRIGLLDRLSGSVEPYAVRAAETSEDKKVELSLIEAKGLGFNFVLGDHILGHKFVSAVEIEMPQINLTVKNTTKLDEHVPTQVPAFLMDTKTIVNHQRSASQMVLPEFISHDQARPPWDR